MMQRGLKNMTELNTSPAQLNNLGETQVCRGRTTCLPEGISASQIRIAGIEEESIVDGPGIRLVVFTQGCSHKCKGCHNPKTHSYVGGYEIEIDDIINMIKSNPLLDGITISGGEPFDQAFYASQLAKKVKGLGLNVVTYTGYTFEELMSNTVQNQGYRDLILETDILIDGKFEITQKDLTLPFRGSKNQRIIDVKNSIISNKIILYRGENYV